MNKAELAAALAEKLQLPKTQTERMIEETTEIITQTLKSGGEVNIAGFGAFLARTRKGRTGVNPRNPTEKIQIADVTVPKFKAGKNLKDALKEKPTA
ncbi:HU family DNA-binding protein [Patescibacteria group bacterium]|nr:MAG: HU family DNA-binding protein [Patescibacteria group bacterium]